MSLQPQECTVCGYPRQFVEYRTKEGKDGRTAKWPHYEDCPRKDDPKFHPSADPTHRFKDLLEQRVQRRILASGTIWSTYPKGVWEGMAEALERFEERFGQLPTVVALNAESAEGETELEWETQDGKPVTLPIRTDFTVQRYDIFLALEVDK